MYIHTYMYIIHTYNTCMYIYIYIYVERERDLSLSLSLYIYIYIERERYTHMYMCTYNFRNRVLAEATHREEGHDRTVVMPKR